MGLINYFVSFISQLLNLKP